MKKIILLTVIVAAFILNGCGESSSQPNFKNMAEIEKLSKDEFAEETAALNKHVIKEMDKLLDKHAKIDAKFEDAIAELHHNSVKQMIEYGKVLDKKDEETRRDYVVNSLMAMWENAEETEGEAFEAKFEKRIPEFKAFGSESLEQIFDDLFALMDFLNFEDAKERHPVTAKEFGIQ